MTERLDSVTLANVAKGAAPEVFAHLFATVLDNIRDHNTDPAAARTVTLKFHIKPVGQDRDEARVILEPSIKLATPCHRVEGVVYIGPHQATTRDVHQGDLYEDPDVHPMKNPAVS